MHSSALPRGKNDFSAFLDALDALDQRIAFTDCMGHMIFATGVMRQLLSERPELVRQMPEFALQVCDQARESTRSNAIGERVAMREVLTKSDAWVVRASHIAFDVFGSGSGVLFSVERLPSDPLAPRRLNERFALSKQECRVARLLALGRSNAEIAKELCISPHTARHHIQRIVDKAGAPSRAALVSTLLRLAE